MTTARRNVRYARLPQDEDDDYDSSGFCEGRRRRELDDPRFAYNPKSLDRVPWKSIALALFLLSLGSLLLLLAFFVFTGHMPGESSQAYGFLLLGVLAFLPGFYETRVAYYSWRGAPGYRFTSIPDY